MAPMMTMVSRLSQVALSHWPKEGRLDMAYGSLTWPWPCPRPPKKPPLAGAGAAVVVWPGSWQLCRLKMPILWSRRGGGMLITWLSVGSVAEYKTRDEE